MILTDHEVFTLIKKHDLQMGEIFIADNQVYCWRNETELEFERCTFNAYDEKALVNSLRRFGVTEYDAITEVSDEIIRAKEWNKIFVLLGKILDFHGKQDPFGNGDFYLADDDYGYLQHKVECATKALLTQALIIEVQVMLQSLDSHWEIIFALPPIDGKEYALLVYSDAVVEHNG